MADVARVVEERAALLDRVEVLRERLEVVPRHAREQRVGRHVLDVLQRADEQLAVLGPHRRDREPAVAGDDARDAVPARRAERRVPEHLRVVVGVDVDEARGSRRGPPASSTRVAVEPVADLGDHAVGDRDVGRRPGAPVPSTSVPPRMTTSAVMVTSSSLLAACRSGARASLGTPAARTLTPVSGSGDPLRHGRHARPIRPCPPRCRRPSSWACATSRSRTGRRPRSGPDDVLLEVSHCGICGSDLHFLLEWGGQAGRDRGPRVQRHDRRGRATRSTGWEVGDRVVAGPVAECGTCEYCRAHRPSLCVERGRVGADDGRLAGRVRPLQDDPGGRAAAHPRAPRVEARGARRADGRRAARHHARRRRPAGHALARHRRRADRVPVGRRAEGARRRRHRRERAARTPARAVRAARRAHGRSPTSSQLPAMPHDMVDEPFDVALECSGNDKAMEAALAQLKRAGTLVLVGAGIRAPEVRQQPHPAERARDHRRVRLRPRRLPARARAARVGRSCRSTCSSKPTTSRSTGCSTPRSACTKARSRRR